MDVQDVAGNQLNQNPVHRLKNQIPMRKQPSPASEYTAGCPLLFHAGK